MPRLVVSKYFQTFLNCVMMIWIVGEQCKRTTHPTLAYTFNHIFHRNLLTLQSESPHHFFSVSAVRKKITTNYKCDAGMLFYLVTTTMTTRIHLKPKDLKAKLRTKELTNEHQLQHKSKLQTRMTERERLILYLLSAWERVKRTWERERETKSMKVESRFFSPDFFKYYAFLRREKTREREKEEDKPEGGEKWWKEEATTATASTTTTISQLWFNSQPHADTFVGNYFSFSLLFFQLNISKCVCVWVWTTTAWTPFRESCECRMTLAVCA